MTRKECEAKLLALAEQMYAVYKEYNHSGDFLSMIADSSGYISVDDAYFNADGKIINDANGNTFKTVDCVKYKDGSIRLFKTIIRTEEVA